MFERLTERLQDTFKTLSGRGKLTEANIGDAMREVRRALLEADVSYPVVKDFIKRVQTECLGEKVLRSVSPGQQAIKVVHDHLVSLLGQANVPLELAGKPAVIMLVGLHGGGKTTTAAKLAQHLRDKLGRKPLLAAGDLYRPAAIEQLRLLGQQLNIPVHLDETCKDVARIAADAKAHAARHDCDVVVIDTAGRLQIDTGLVQELIDIKRRVDPREILLVADAALGQEAVSVAEHFDQALGISGIILTKLDGDARGGAALSMRQVTGQPIKFVGTGEKLQDLEPFHPERMAGRILGMGDIVGLVERAASHIQEEEAARLEEKLRKNKFDLEDFLSQLRSIRKMGGFMSMLDMLPGMGKLKDQANIDERQFNRIEGMICAMTAEERRNPALIDLSRRRRIARGSGVEVTELSQLLKQFEMMRKMMSKLNRQVGKMPKLPGLGGGMPDMGDLEGMLGGGMGAGMAPGLGGGFGAGPGRGPRNQKAKRKKNKKKR